MSKTGIGTDSLKVGAWMWYGTMSPRCKMHVTSYIGIYYKTQTIYTKSS